MALRDLRYAGDSILQKKAKPVKEITQNVLTLLDDMSETLTEKNGVGLAAPQVGVLRRIAIVDIGEGLIEMINPEIIETTDEQESSEGCLSVPGRTGKVLRPAKVKVKAMDRNGEEFVVEGEGLLAIAFCHEIDHLDGILYTDKAFELSDILEDDEDEEFDEE